ncbi:hypothetical protein [Aquimarina sp. 2201CG5-10]|uniref:hypothetical protein n=1 Tax=Aquimarina callyspongiae TaxID=3098150 RepID=UPI002AB499E0|nr:hypothetical protein [Aquimarina sp. 2201CG5-10]MDY8136826.1 hypothetical protein [Aquimarina sp. 2201CG5-10]
MESGIITGIVASGVTLFGVLLNWYLSIQNKKKEIEQKEYQFLLENLKEFWNTQNRLYSETLKVTSELVLSNEIRSEKYLENYNRFWELYWAELPTCESREVESAMVRIKDLIHEKKHIKDGEEYKLEDLRKPMKSALLNLSKAVRDSSILLEYSESIKNKFKESS